MTSQRLSWGMGKLEVELSEDTVGEFELPPWKAEMSAVLLFINPLGRVQGTVGSLCLWCKLSLVAKPPRASLITFLLGSVNQPFLPPLASEDVV